MFQAQRSGDYIFRIITELSLEVDTTRFQKAWDDVVAMVPILRTRIVELPGQGLVQVVFMFRPSDWNQASSIEEHQRREKEQECNQRAMCTGMPLIRLGLIESSGRRFFGWTLHHALYDGWSLPLIQRAVEQIYHTAKPSQLVPLQPSVKYSKNKSSQLTDAF